MRKLQSSFLLCLITFCPVTARPADEFESRPHRSAIANALEARLYIKHETLRVVFPPSETIKAGDIVRFNNDGLPEEIASLPRSAYTSYSTHVVAEYQEMRSDPNLKLAKSLLDFENSSKVAATVTYFVDGLDVERFESSGVAQDETHPDHADAIKALSEEPRERPRAPAVDNALLNSTEAKTAFGHGAKLWLVTNVVRGRAIIDIDFRPQRPLNIRQKGDTYFVAEHPPTESTVRLVSHFPLTVAFQCEAVDFVPDPLNPTDFIGVQRTVSKLTPGDFGHWEKAPAAYGAPSKPVAHVVTVHYATDRAPSNWESYYHTFWAKSETGFCILATILLLIVGAALLLFRATRRYGIPLVLIAILVAVVLRILAGQSASARVEEDSKQGFVAYGGNDANRLEYGVVQVTVPIDRAIGSIPTPFSILTFHLPSDPSQHFTLADVKTSKDDEEFFSALKQRLNASTRKQAFIFVHGYNTTFKDAAFRTAQLWYDLAFEGAPILYSWPSQGAELDYPVDEQQAGRTTVRFESFLKDVVERSGAEQVHLIAHSMGNRVVSDSLESIGKQNSLVSRQGILKELVMAAPDVDPVKFKQQQLNYAARLVQRITLYASLNDIPLNYSRKIHGDSRLGIGGPSIFVDARVNSIDASKLRTDRDSHGYVMSNDIVLGDMHQLVVNGLAPSQRFGLIKRSATQNGHDLSCWEFRTRDR